MFKIMIIEDNPTNLFLYKETLERAGHEVIMRANGIDAVKTIVIEKPDLLILDAILPVIDGFQILKEIKKAEVISGDMPVMFISAALSVPEMMRRTGLPEENLMTKPIDFQTLLKRIEILCINCKNKINDYAGR